MGSNTTKISYAKRLVSDAKRIVAFSGAGISTESGLSDFRSKGGLWDRYRMVTYQEFLASHEGRVEYWSMRRELIPSLLQAKPNAAHHALSKLEKDGLNVKLVAAVSYELFRRQPSVWSI